MYAATREELRDQMLDAADGESLRDKPTRTQTPLGRQQFYAFPAEPDPAIMEGVAKVFQGRDPDDKLIVMFVRFHRFGGLLHYQIHDQDNFVPASWIEEGDGEEWRVYVEVAGGERVPADWHGAVAAAHDWARFLVTPA